MFLTAFGPVRWVTWKLQNQSNENLGKFRKIQHIIILCTNFGHRGRCLVKRSYIPKQLFHLSSHLVWPGNWPGTSSSRMSHVSNFCSGDQGLREWGGFLEEAWANKRRWSCAEVFHQTTQPFKVLYSCSGKVGSAENASWRHKRGCLNSLKMPLLSSSIFSLGLVLEDVRKIHKWGEWGDN